MQSEKLRKRKNFALKEVWTTNPKPQYFILKSTLLEGNFVFLIDFLFSYKISIMIKKF